MGAADHVTQRIATTFYEIAMRMARKYGEPLPTRLLEVGRDDIGWHVTLNPTGKELQEVKPYEAHVSWNGWPAGVIHASGGILAAGDAANEDSLIEWLRSDGGTNGKS